MPWDKIKCIVCGRDKYNYSNVCKPCRMAVNRMIKYGLDNDTIYIVMMYGKHRRCFSHDFVG